MTYERYMVAKAKWLSYEELKDFIIYGNENTGNI